MVPVESWERKLWQCMTPLKSYRPEADRGRSVRSTNPGGGPHMVVTSEQPPSPDVQAASPMTVKNRRTQPKPRPQPAIAARTGRLTRGCGCRRTSPRCPISCTRTTRPSSSPRPSPSRVRKTYRHDYHHSRVGYRCDRTHTSGRFRARLREHTGVSADTWALPWRHSGVSGVIGQLDCVRHSVGRISLGRRRHGRPVTQDQIRWDASPGDRVTYRLS